LIAVTSCPGGTALRIPTFFLTDVNAKRRYEINKGLKNFEVRQIDPRDYKERMFEVQVAAFADYPEKYRPSVNKDAFLENVES